MRISDWSSDVCSSDLPTRRAVGGVASRSTLRIADRASLAVFLSDELGNAGQALRFKKGGLERLALGEDAVHQLVIVGRARRDCRQRDGSKAKLEHAVACHALIVIFPLLHALCD